MMPAMLRFHEAGERRRRGGGAVKAGRGAVKAGRRPVTARQETSDGEAGTIRDAARLEQSAMRQVPGYS